MMFFFFPLCIFSLFKMTVHLHNQRKDCCSRKYQPSRKAVDKALLVTLTLHRNIDCGIVTKGCVLVGGIYLSGNGTWL